MEEQHVYHHYDSQPAPVRIKLERGQKGTYAFEVTASGATVDEALALLREADARLRSEYCGEA